MSLRRFGLVMTAAVLAFCAAGTAGAQRAEARGFFGFGFGVPVVYPAPVYAPPPVYYAPPPVYYPAGVAYAPGVIYRRRYVVHHYHHVRHVVHSSCTCCKCSCP